MQSIYLTLMFFLGASIGSFANVVFIRVSKGISIVKPRSYCPACNKTIEWYRNIPVISYIMLDGKCHSCKNTIPIKYFWFEIEFGMIGLLAGAYLIHTNFSLFY